MGDGMRKDQSAKLRWIIRRAKGDTIKEKIKDFGGRWNLPYSTVRSWYYAGKLPSQAAHWISVYSRYECYADHIEHVERKRELFRPNGASGRGEMK